MSEKIDNIEKEKAALNALLDRGLKFETPRRKIFGRARKPRIWTIKQPYLGTLDHLSLQLLDIDFDEDRIKADPMKEGRQLTFKNSRQAAKIVAIAVLNSYWGIKLFSGILARYFAWKITPSLLFQLALIINTISNVGDFTNSIRLLYLVRTSEPKADRIE